MPARRFIALTLALLLGFAPEPAGASPGKLYLLPDFRDPAIADAALGFIRCAFDRSGVFVEITEKESAGRPLLALAETESGKIRAALLRLANGAREPLGEISPADLPGVFCERFFEETLPAAPAPIPTATAAAIAPVHSETIPAASTAAPPVSGKTFLERNWPYFAVGAALAVGGFFAVRALSGKTESHERYESRGFIVR